MIDLTGSELDADHLAVIMRWLGERLSVHSDASRNLASGGLTKWRLKRVLSYIDQHLCEPITLRNSSWGSGAEQKVFAAQFRAATGCSLTECVLRRKDPTRAADAARAIRFLLVRFVLLRIGNPCRARLWLPFGSSNQL